MGERRPPGAFPQAQAASGGGTRGGRGPVIPVNIIDAPTQRFYTLACYVGLLAWKSYDWALLVEDNSESFVLFLKWIVLDFAFLFGLPELRIPWLELSQPVVIFLFLTHVFFDYFLMFNIGVPWNLWLVGLFRVFYDRELSISERYVKTASLLHNSSLISGRQIINILPEGSAVLNPRGLPFCIGNSGDAASIAATSAHIPLYLNATTPELVELVRRDFATNEEEVVKLSKAQLKDIARAVRQQTGATPADEAVPPVRYDVLVKKTGAYRLGRVLDEYKLDVQRPSPFTFVVACPTARVGAVSGQAVAKQTVSHWGSSSASQPLLKPVTRCHGELSDLLLEVDGTPPLKIVYSRTINGKDHSFHFQSLQPDGFSSPLLGLGSTVGLPAAALPPSRGGGAYSDMGPEADADAMILAAAAAVNIPSEGGSDIDISWAASQRVSVELNETMHVGGEWQYAIDEVHDAFGNVAKYNEAADDQHDVRPASPSAYLQQNFLVRERPRIRLHGCDLRQPLKVARGKSTHFPVRYELPGVQRATDSTAHTLTWQFSPIDSLTKSGDHGDVVVTEVFNARHGSDQPAISAPGLYTLQSVESDSCEGEVQEPSSCLLLNPLEPKLSLRAEGIPDSCGGQSIGLRVDLDLVGTPPFLVRYDVSTNGVVRQEKVQIPGMRFQMELIPRVAGHHKYLFRSVDDAVYKAQPLSGPEMALEQNVKPPARAALDHPTGRANVCLEDNVGVDVSLSGEAPFTLEWVLLHEGKRKTFKAENIVSNRHRIETPPLVQGGEYTLALTSVHDRSGCRTFLQTQGGGGYGGSHNNRNNNSGELKISVRRQRPRAAFGLIENRRRVYVVEGASVRLPLRLTGEGPWRVAYENLGTETDAGDKNSEEKKLEWLTLNSGNDFLEVKSRGRYEIADVSDHQCQGVVDAGAAVFEVDWFPRPELSFVPNEAVQKEGAVFFKQEVCEGDIDGFEIDLKGSPPFHVEYDVRHQPAKGPSTSLIHKELDAALSRAAIQMDTSKAGTYRYEFAAPADSLYNGNKPRSGYGNGNTGSELVLQQTVYAKPTAAFVRPGQSFKYCMAEQDNEETIPIVLTGVPPFYVEIEIRHQSGSGSGTTAPETFRVPSIRSHSYGLQVPRQYLRPGTQQIRIRKVRDARGCQQMADDVGVPASQVQVQLFEAPSIYALEARKDYCVGERISYTLSGTPPFDVWYTFGGAQRKGSSPTTTFRRVAEAPGVFSVTGITDRASECRAAVNLTRTIHPLPSVRISRGQTLRTDIHEGGAVEILFEFGGTPPFEFTYTRSTNAKRKGQRQTVLETRHDVSYDMVKAVRASQEGTYEVVAIKDRFCAFSTRGVEEKR